MHTRSPTFAAADKAHTCNVNASQLLHMQTKLALPLDRAHTRAGFGGSGRIDATCDGGRQPLFSAAPC